MTSKAPPTDKQALGRRRLAERRLRVLRIRQRVVAGAVSVFLALFSGLYVQMASGNDPVLAEQTTTSVGSSTAATSSTDEGTSSADTSSAADSTESTTDTEESEEPAAVTTAQS